MYITTVSVILHTLILCSGITDLDMEEGSASSEGPGCASHTSVADDRKNTDS